MTIEYSIIFIYLLYYIEIDYKYNANIFLDKRIYLKQYFFLVLTFIHSIGPVSPKQQIQ